MAAARTAPSGAVVPPPVLDFEKTLEEVMSIRYCPLSEFEARAAKIALRIANAEGHAWELEQQAKRRGSGT